MVLGVELLVIFSCDSFPSLPVIHTDREDWCVTGPPSKVFHLRGCLWVTFGMPGNLDFFPYFLG